MLGLDHLWGSLTHWLFPPVILQPPHSRIHFIRPYLSICVSCICLAGAMYGKGSYFAVNPTYSQNYAQVDTQGHRHMYQAQVLVGDYTQGISGMITPPAKSGNAADLYDSVTDKMHSPTMFVIFNDIQAYPEYLITFSWMFRSHTALNTWTSFILYFRLV